MAPLLRPDGRAYISILNSPLTFCVSVYKNPDFEFLLPSPKVPRSSSTPLFQQIPRESSSSSDPSPSRSSLVRASHGSIPEFLCSLRWAPRPDPAPASDPRAASERDRDLVRVCSRRHAVRGEIWVICLTCCAVKCVLVFDQELRCLIPDVPPIIILATSHHHDHTHQSEYLSA